jgi:hypothetical protein
MPQRARGHEPAPRHSRVALWLGRQESRRTSSHPRAKRDRTAQTRGDCPQLNGGRGCDRSLPDQHLTGEARSRASNREPRDGVQAELLEQRDRIEDRVKNLYEKLGVASRQELVTRVFGDGTRGRVPDTAHIARALRPRLAGLEQRCAFRTGTT